MTDTMAVAVEAAAVEQTEQVETATDAAVEIATVEADARVEQTALETAAAVEIAETAAQAEDAEDERLWQEFLDRFAAVEATVARLSAMQEETLAAVSAIAAAMIAPTHSTPTNSEQVTEVIPAEVTVETPDQNAEVAPSAPETPRRRFRLL